MEAYRGTFSITCRAIGQPVNTIDANAKEFGENRSGRRRNIGKAYMPTLGVNCESLIRDFLRRRGVERC